ALALEAQEGVEGAVTDDTAEIPDHRLDRHSLPLLLSHRFEERPRLRMAERGLVATMVTAVVRRELGARWIGGGDASGTVERLDLRIDVDRRHVLHPARVEVRHQHRLVDRRGYRR